MLQKPILHHRQSNPRAMLDRELLLNASTTSWARQRDLFKAALDLAPEAWPDFIAAHTQDSPELAANLQALLDSVRAQMGNTGALVEGVQQSVENLANPNTTGQRLGAYQLVEEIGRGGMGIVWRATRQDDQVQQTVAIKLLAAHRWDATSRARFQAEREALASLEIQALPD